MLNRISYFFLLCFFLTDSHSFAQNIREVYWGVNYCMPFAHGYRAHQRLGIDHKAAVDRDIYHLSRMGVNAFRVHVWDVEITDLKGNLLENTHLDLLDYTISEMSKRGIKTTLTPLAFWGNGYPEPSDRSLQGFSNKWGKSRVTFEEEAVKAQENYLVQFLNHLNPYTGKKYKDDPNIWAFEVNNEPDQSGENKADSVANYVKRMLKAIHSTGCKKPIYYNIAENPSLTDTYLSMPVDGITFQWYPTALKYGHTRTDNVLPIISHYNIPFRDKKTFKNKRLMIYEFDAADVLGSYVYPAMARSFREAGFDWATMFSYDPFFIADVNTDYITHYMNLAYTPNKAVSLKIAGEAFRSIPRNKSFGDYPENNRFANITLSYEDNLGLLNSDSLFYYTNNTSAVPVNAPSLIRVAGVGSSQVAQYDGTGAYFIDRISDGIWRLEVYPDVFSVSDPFTSTSPDKKVTVLQNNYRNIKINLPNLGSDFIYRPVSAKAKVLKNNEDISVYPGVYLLIRKDKENIQIPDNSRIGNIQIGEYYDSPDYKGDIEVTHTPAHTAFNDKVLNISADIISSDTIKSVTVLIENMNSRMTRIPMKKGKGFSYFADIRTENIQNPCLKYYIVVTTNTKKEYTFPGKYKGSPYKWDFSSTEYYNTIIVKQGEPVNLFDYRCDPDKLNVQLGRGISVILKDEIDDLKPEIGNYNYLKLGINYSNATNNVSIVLIDREGYWWRQQAAVSGHTLEMALDNFRPCESERTPVYPSLAFVPIKAKDSKAILNPENIVTVFAYTKTPQELFINDISLIKK